MGQLKSARMAQNKKQPCKLCGTSTVAVFNIKFKAVPICESCASSVFIQQAQWYVQQDYSHLYEPDARPNLSTTQQKAYDFMNENVGMCIWEKNTVEISSFVKVNDDNTVTEITTHNLDGTVVLPKLTLAIVKALVSKGYIKLRNTRTTEHGKFTYYHKL